MSNIAIWIKYDGTHYSGWQRQPKHKTVQGVIEKKLSRVLGTEVVIHGSGRTDSGVHALSQCASFTADLIMPEDRLKYALNRVLPVDILVHELKVMPDDFHARYSAKGKTYIYKVYLDEIRDPFKDNYYYHYPHKLDLDAIQEGMKFFLGTHDFKTFMASGSAVSNTVRTIHSFEVEQVGNTLEFTISGDGFLYNMVRIIIGTLFQVSRGKTSPDEIPLIIANQDRSGAKWTAPPNGLYLKDVHY